MKFLEDCATQEHEDLQGYFWNNQVVVDARNMVRVAYGTISIVS